MRIIRESYSEDISKFFHVIKSSALGYSSVIPATIYRNIQHLESDDNVKSKLTAIISSTKSIESKVSDIVEVFYEFKTNKYGYTNLNLTVWDSIKPALKVILSAGNKFEILNDRIEYFLEDFTHKYLGDNSNSVSISATLFKDNEIIYNGYIIRIDLYRGNSLSLEFNFDEDDDVESRNRAINSLLLLDKTKDRMTRMYPNIFISFCIKNYSRIEVKIYDKDEHN